MQKLMQVLCDTFLGMQQLTAPWAMSLAAAGCTCHMHLNCS